MRRFFLLCNTVFVNYLMAAPPPDGTVAIRKFMSNFCYTIARLGDVANRLFLTRGAFRFVGMCRASTEPATRFVREVGWRRRSERGADATPETRDDRWDGGAGVPRFGGLGKIVIHYGKNASATIEWGGMIRMGRFRDRLTRRVSGGNGVVWGDGSRGCRHP
jgi:hypothetical protein